MEVGPDTPAVGAPPGGKGGEDSSASKQEPSGVGQSTAEDPPLTPPPVDKDASLSVGAAQSDRVISPHVPSTPTSDHQPTPSGSLSAEKETSESALTPTAALTVLTLGSAAGKTCLCVRVCLWHACMHMCVCSCVCVASVSTETLHANSAEFEALHPMSLLHR